MYMHTNLDKSTQLNCLQSNLRKATRIVSSIYEREFVDLPKGKINVFVFYV